MDKMVNRLTSFIVSFFITLIILILLPFFLQKGESYTFILDNKQVDSVQKCSLWNYNNISFIPCLWEGQIQGIRNQLINYTLSPEQNCELYNSTFIGFNLKNQTKAEEIYNSVISTCQTIYAKDVNLNWLKQNAQCVNLTCPIFYSSNTLSNCVRDYNSDIFKNSVEGKCSKWVSDGLVIIRK